MNKPNRQPNAPVSQAPSVPLIDDEEAFVQKVWETTYSACLASVLSPRANTVTKDDKYIIRDIHKALELANIAKSAAMSYIENGKRQVAEQEAAKAGDPLSKLVGDDTTTKDQP